MKKDVLLTAYMKDPTFSKKDKQGEKYIGANSMNDPTTESCHSDVLKVVTLSFPSGTSLWYSERLR